MPNYHGYETTTEHYMAPVRARRTSTTTGKSRSPTDPAVADVFAVQKKLVDASGGFSKLERFRADLR